MSPIAHAVIASALFASGAPQAASLAERARDDCATEISMFCAGQDVIACLMRQRDDLTARCRDTLSGQSPTQVAAHAAIALDTDRPRLAAPPAGAVGAEAPRALQEVAKLIGQSSYRAAFPRPLVLQVEYDPTQRNGLGFLDASGSGEGQRVTFNMAYWEDCPSRPILRSVVTHEFAHAALHDLVGEGGMTHVPQWFDEGLGTLAGGEPAVGISLDAAYYRHGSGYPGPLACRLENEGPGLMGVGLITDCYPYYLLAVRHIAESSPEALPGVIYDLRAGIAMERTIPARVGLSWNAFKKAIDERVRRTFKRMSPLSRLTGRGWWRHVRWCRG